MDIKDLNKSQLILLAVLLSFITSIATGITTVTLMQQAPTSFTAPVNRVIQQTVEKIQQVEGKTTVQTVVVKEEDLVVDAIAKNKSAVFAVTTDGYDADGNDAEIALGRAFAITSDGLFVADGANVPKRDVYYLKNSSGKFKAEFISKDAAGFSFLKIGEPVGSEAKPAFTVPTPGDVSKMKIGQKVIILGSTISSSIFEGDEQINTGVTPANGGGLVLNLDGEALGVALSSDGKAFVPIGVIKEAAAKQ